jgi:hypothetical protein
MGQMKIEQHEVRLMKFGRRNRAIGIFGHRDYAVARIVFDQILESYGKLTVVFDDEDLEHPRASRNSAEIPPGKSVTWS